MTEHRIEDLISIFDRLFFDTFNTRLVRGGDEPIYLPADEQLPYHRLVFARGFFSSALHEVAHWCIAGTERRQLVDFGYWYNPDGRTAVQQRSFEAVEVKPQALEWLFSHAAGCRFFVSADNLSGEPTDNAGFKQRVLEQVTTYCRDGLPERAALFREALCGFYGTSTEPDLGRFQLEVI